MSGGLDGVIKIWDLERMIEIYSFEVHTNSDEGAVDELYKLQLINDRLYAIFTKGHQNSIEIGQIPHLVNSFFISKPVIQSTTKGFKNWSQQAQSSPDSIIVSFDNNSVMLLDAVTGDVKSTVYPPPTPTLIDKILYQMSLSRLFILLKNGMLCTYKTWNRETATLEKLQEGDSSKMRDADNKTLSGSKITSIALTSIVPPHSDCELFSEAGKVRQLP